MTNLYRTYDVQLWQPGDGLHCSHATRSSRSIPCSRPVATRYSTPSDGQGKPRKEVLCAIHILDKPAHRITNEAERQAQEEVLAAHYDEYRELVQRRVQEQIDTAVAALPDELRAMALKALEAS